MTIDFISIFFYFGRNKLIIIISLFSIAFYFFAHKKLKTNSYWKSLTKKAVSIMNNYLRLSNPSILLNYQKEKEENELYYNSIISDDRERCYKDTVSDLFSFPELFKKCPRENPEKYFCCFQCNYNCKLNTLKNRIKYNILSAFDIIHSKIIPKIKKDEIKKVHDIFFLFEKCDYAYKIPKLEIKVEPGESLLIETIIKICNLQYSMFDFNFGTTDFKVFLNYEEALNYINNPDKSLHIESSHIEHKSEVKKYFEHSYYLDKFSLKNRKIPEYVPNDYGLGNNEVILIFKARMRNNKFYCGACNSYTLMRLNLIKMKIINVERFDTCECGT